MLAPALWLTASRNGRLSAVLLLFSMQLAFAAVGALLSSRVPGNPIGWVFLGVGVSIAVSLAGEEYARRTLDPAMSALPAGHVAAVMSNALGSSVLIAALVWLLLLFPDGRLPSRRWRPVAGVAAIASLAAVVYDALSNNIGYTRNPIAPGGHWGQAVAVLSIGYLTLFGLMVVAALSLISRFRGARGVQRQQLKCLGLAAAVAATSYLLGLLVFWSNPSPWARVASVVALTVGPGSLPIATAVAILRYRLFEVDVIIRKTLVYATLIALLTCAYLSGIYLVNRAVQTVSQQSSAFAVSLSTLAVVAAFQPLRTRVQRAVDRRFYRRKYDAARILDAFSGRLREQVDLDALGVEVLDVVRATVQPGHVSLWLRRSEPAP